MSVPIGRRSARGAARISPIAVASVVALTAGAATAPAARRGDAAQAAMFRGGAAHAGEYRTAGVPAFGGLQWRVQTGGPVRTSPTVAGGTAYAGSSDGFLYAIDVRTGDVRWRRAMGGAVASSAAVADGLVYVNGRDGLVQALRAADGAVAWTFKAGPDLPLAWGQESGLFYVSSPTVAGSAVLVGAGDGNLYALDAHTGRERWRFRAGARLYSSPSVDGGTAYVGSQRGVLWAVDVASGRERWHYETEGAGLRSADFGFDRTTIQSSPAIAGDGVYFGARDGFLYALDRTTGKLRWRFDHKVSWVNSSPAVSDGLVYAGSSDGHFVQAVDAATGRERWRAPTEDIVWTSPAVDDARVYVGEGNGTMYALDKTSGKEAWRYRAGRALFSSPSLADGRLYFGSDDGGIYAVNAAKGESMRRAVFWDTTHVSAPLTTGFTFTRSYLVEHGYQQLDAAALARFMSERVRDRAPSAVVFAVDRLPDAVAATAADTVLFRRYLNAGGTVVWLGTPPLLAPLNAAGLKDLRRDATATLLGVRHTRGNFDMTGVSRVTAAGKRLGLPDWWIDSWPADPEDVTTVLAYDEQGLAAAWVKSYGGPPGTGFVRVVAGSGNPGRPMSHVAVQTAAELRPTP